MRILVGFILKDNASVVATKENSNILVYNTETYAVEIIKGSSEIPVLIYVKSEEKVTNANQIYAIIYSVASKEEDSLITSTYPVYSANKNIVAHNYCVALGRTNRNTYLILDNNFTVFELQEQQLIDWLSKYKILNVDSLTDARNLMVTSYAKEDSVSALSVHKKLETTLARSKMLNANVEQTMSSLLSVIQKSDVTPVCQVYKSISNDTLVLNHLLTSLNTFPQEVEMEISQPSLFRTVCFATISRLVAPNLLGVHLVAPRVIAAEAFCYCTNLKTILFSGVDSLIIKSKAFANTKITSIKLPYGVTSIAPDAFENCKELRLIRCPAHLAQTLKSFNLVSKPEIVEY